VLFAKASYLPLLTPHLYPGGINKSQQYSMFPRRQSSGSCVITNNLCPHSFPGHRTFKSPEVNNIANFVCTLPNVVANALKSVYESIFNVTIIKNHSFSAHCFQVDRLCYLLYPGRGNILDCMYNVVGITYSCSVYLRDTGAVSVPHHQGSR